MTQGRELDKLIAEKVMGLKPCFCSQEQKAMWMQLNPGAYAWLDGRCNVCGNSRIDFYRYSTDISAAWQVVEKLKWAEPEIKYSDEQHCWFCSMHKANNYPNESGDTAPHAICLAALKAVGYEP